MNSLVHFSLQIASSVPSYKERLRTVLLKAQFQERMAQIKPVRNFSKKKNVNDDDDTPFSYSTSIITIK